MPKIVIAYRREDSGDDVARLYARLVSAFGEISVFRDLDDVPPGTSARNVLEEAVQVCDALLVMIGPGWATFTEDDGIRRLDDPNDYIRFEIETALREDDITIIPVLVGGATMPTESDLPPSLHPFAALQPSTLRHDADTDALVQRLRAVPTAGRVISFKVGDGEPVPLDLSEMDMPKIGNFSIPFLVITVLFVGVCCFVYSIGYFIATFAVLAATTPGGLSGEPIRLSLEGNASNAYVCGLCLLPLLLSVGTYWLAVRRVPALRRISPMGEHDTNGETEKRESS